MTIPTYEPAPPEPFPMYLDKRVYQGSSGRVYPLPFHHQIEREARDRDWQAVHLQNEWMHVVVLPELGGRVHAARDLVTGKDLFYVNPVIKPALVGLAGPWTAGGIEFNWPQHHRPATHLPSDWTLEKHEDGSATVWCGDHDPFQRMQALHGVRLRPDSSAIEVSVRLNNRTELEQTFLWWANAAAQVHDDYQVFFPHDVRYVADHAKRAITAFPAADRPYYGVDYAARREDEVAAADGTDVAGDRIDWYRNIPVPTSYMCVDSRENFFGGYDHSTELGFVHVADRQVAVGKKMWTWGNSEFGHAWERNLADDDAHYIELMAGVFTDNQPDFAYLAPGETKCFTQAWYPIRQTGPIDRASDDAAVSLHRRTKQDASQVEARIAASRIIVGAHVELRAGGQVIAAEDVNLDPGRTITVTAAAPSGNGPVSVHVTTQNRTLVAWSEDEATAGADEPAAAVEPSSPSELDSVEELALVADHLELYRHATRSPEPYWDEALRRDPGHVPSLTGKAQRAYRRGDLDAAQDALHQAVERLTALHPTPRDMTPIYMLGLVEEAAGRDEAAYDNHGRASWSRTWRAAAGYRMALLDARNGRDREALHRLEDVRRAEPEHLQALALTVICLRRQDRPEEATIVLRRARALNPLDGLCRALDGEAVSIDPQICLDIALDLAAAGELEHAHQVLDEAENREKSRDPGQTALGPLPDYHRALLYAGAGREGEAQSARRRARQADATGCYPARREDIVALLAAGAEDPVASGLAGHWYYAMGRSQEAVAAWELSAGRDGTDPVVQRNLAIDLVNRFGDLEAARSRYERALELVPHEPRLDVEIDQLDALRGVAADERVARWLRRWDHAARRDDARVRLAHLLVTTGDAPGAARLLTENPIQPWEGGEGEALAAWERAGIRQATSALRAGDGESAVRHLRGALTAPASLGEGRHPLASTAQIELLLGDALALAGRPEDAQEEWRRAAEQSGDFLAMSPQDHSENTAWSIIALRRIGRPEQAQQMRGELEGFVDDLAQSSPVVDYFATSLPDLLLFTEDPTRGRDRRVLVLRAQLHLLDGERDRALALLEHPDLVATRAAGDLADLLDGENAPQWRLEAQANPPN